MALAPGTPLGVYEVTAQIGEGGMGQVYQARDTKLHRDVALKILPDAFARDPDQACTIILQMLTRHVQRARRNKRFAQPCSSAAQRCSHDAQPLCGTARLICHALL